MIDVNAITELLIQHSQSTGFDKSLEMLTQTLKQLTDPNKAASPAATASSFPQNNPLENLLIKTLQTPIAPPVLPPQMWFNPNPVPPFFPSPSSQRSNPNSMDFHPQHQFPNQRN